MHLVLDLDGTLADHDGTRFTPRPHLIPFLRWALAHFESVRIWTAASREWWCAFYHQELAARDIVFDEVLTQEDCILRRSSWYAQDAVTVLKPLEILYARHAEMNAENTIIVDDTPSTAAQNPQNLYLIPEFDGRNYADEELLELMQYLRGLL